MFTLKRQISLTLSHAYAREHDHVDCPWRTGSMSTARPRPLAHMGGCYHLSYSHCWRCRRCILTVCCFVFLSCLECLLHGWWQAFSPLHNRILYTFERPSVAALVRFSSSPARRGTGKSRSNPTFNTLLEFVHQLGCSICSMMCPQPE